MRSFQILFTFASFAAAFKKTAFIEMAVSTVKWGTASQPLRKLYAPFGEDAFTVSRCGRRVAVADGVGGFYTKHGVSAGVFSRKWTQLVSKGLQGDLKQDAILALDQAARSKSAGTATFALVQTSTIDNGLLLQVLVVGDCKICIMRRRSGIEERWIPAYESSSQRASSNGAPLQTGVSIKGEILNANVLRNAIVRKVSIQRGDIVILGSDGLFDNLADADVATAIDRSFGPPTKVADASPQKISENLVALARKNFFKPDDITVIVGLVR